jgi:hypothetical protein
MGTIELKEMRQQIENHIKEQLTYNSEGNTANILILKN